MKRIFFIKHIRQVRPQSKAEIICHAHNAHNAAAILIARQIRDQHNGRCGECRQTEPVEKSHGYHRINPLNKKIRDSRNQKRPCAEEQNPFPALPFHQPADNWPENQDANGKSTHHQSDLKIAAADAPQKNRQDRKESRKTGENEKGRDK